MARIPDARNIPQTPSARDPGLNIPDQSAAFSGLTQLGEQVQAKAADIQQKKQRAEDIRFAAAYDKEVRKRVAEKVLEFSGQEAETGYAERVSQSVDFIGNTVYQEMTSQGYSPSEETAVRALAGFSNLSSNVQVTALTDEHNAKVEQAVKGVQDQLDFNLNTLLSQPELLEMTIEENNDAIDAASDLLSPTQREALKEKYSNFAHATYIRGLTDKNQFSRARSELASERFNQELNPDTKSKLLDEIDRAELRAQRQAEIAFNKEQRRIEKLITQFNREFEGRLDIAFEGLSPELQGLKDLTNQLPEEIRPQFEARVEGLQTVADNYKGFYYLGSEVQDVVIGNERARLRAKSDVTDAEMEALKALENVAKDSEEQRAYDATVLTLSRGTIDDPPEGFVADFADEASMDWATTAANETVKEQGIDVQPLPRAIFERTSSVMETGTTEEKVAALDFIGQLDLPTQQAVLQSLGSGLTSIQRTAIRFAGENAPLARTILQAEGLKLQDFSYADSQAAALRQVGTAFADSPALLADFVNTARALTAKRIVSEGSDTPDTQSIFEEELQKLTRGSLSTINGQPIILPPSMSGMDGEEVSTIAESKLHSVNSFDELRPAIVPLGPNMQPVEELGGAEILGLYTGGLVEPIPADLDEFTNAPSIGQAAPGVYVPGIESLVAEGGRSFALVKLAVDDNGTRREIFTPAAISLERVMELEAPSAGPIPRGDRTLAVSAGPLRRRLGVLKAQGEGNSIEAQQVLRQLRIVEGNDQLGLDDIEAVGPPREEAPAQPPTLQTPEREKELRDELLRLQGQGKTGTKEYREILNKLRGGVMLNE